MEKIVKKFSVELNVGDVVFDVNDSSGPFVLGDEEYNALKERNEFKDSVGCIHKRTSLTRVTWNTDKPSLINKVKDPKIIEEMKSKVDVALFDNLLCLNDQKTVKGEDGKEHVDPALLDRWLNLWAENKYDYYLMFGREFSLTKKIELELDRDEIKDKFTRFVDGSMEYMGLLNSIDLDDVFTNRYEKSDLLMEEATVKLREYVNSNIILQNLLSQFTLNDFVINKTPNNDYIVDAFPTYKPNCSLSKFLLEVGSFDENFVNKTKEFFAYAKKLPKKGEKLSSAIKKLTDDKFSQKFSKVLQTLKESGYMTISINPIDFMLMSTNQHGWGSCTRLVHNDYRQQRAGICYATDSETIICYKHNGEIYDYKELRFSTTSSGRVTGKKYSYDFGDRAFRYYSFQQRTLIYVDRTCCKLFEQLGYCSMSKGIYSVARCFLQDVMANYLGIPNKWETINIEGRDLVQQRTEFIYIDPTYYTSKPQCMIENKFCISVGSKAAMGS